jgi:hypothetical protein
MVDKNDEKVIWTDKPHNFFGLSVNFTRYLLTSEKLIIRNGFLNIKDDEVMLYRILDKRVERPLWQRVFKCGTLIISAKDVYSPEVTLKSVKNAYALVETLDGLIKEARKTYRVIGRENYGIGADGGGDLTADEIF